jgi:hypothetical protein
VGAYNLLGDGHKIQKHVYTIVVQQEIIKGMSELPYLK